MTKSERMAGRLLGNITACPICHGSIQATVSAYLSNVEIDNYGCIVNPLSYELDVDFDAVELYCENDCDVRDMRKAMGLGT